MELAQWWEFHGWALLAGCVWDWIAGDPYWLPHPVRLMGNMIGTWEGALRKRLGKRLKLAGCFLVLGMVLCWGVLTAAAVAGAEVLSGPGGRVLLFALEAFACGQLLAARSLCQESMKVYQSLKKQDTEEARRNVSMIVGRDTSVLDREGIIKAAVETVAENTSDGVIAPFLFMAFLGPAGGYFYKAVNTMDSMVGYKNERYYLFGRCAARLDDVCNWIPARLTGILLVMTAFLVPWAKGREAWRIFLRDRRKHDSPNSAHGEAACAGALGVLLAGDAWYFGELHKKPWIGDKSRDVEPEDIKRANQLMFGAQAMAMAGLFACLMIIK